MHHHADLITVSLFFKASKEKRKKRIILLVARVVRDSAPTDEVNWLRFSMQPAENVHRIPGFLNNVSLKWTAAIYLVYEPHSWHYCQIACISM